MVIAIAHRGDPINERENTVAALRAAVALGADWVELDLRRARDGTIVVLHDQLLTRLWGAEVSVGELDVEEVQALGEGELRIPTLRQALAAVPTPLMIDFTRREVVAGALADVMAAGDAALERALFVTGNVEALRQLRGLSSAARIGLTWTDGPQPPLELLAELDAEYWNPMFGLVTPGGVDAVHTIGRKVSTWTVDRIDDMRRVVAADVDAVVSNEVATLVACLSALGGGATPG